MAFKLTRVLQNEDMINIFNKGFAILKNTGEGNISLILALAIGYLDAFVLSKENQYYTDIFINSFLTQIASKDPEVSNFIIKALSQDIDALTVECKKSENYDLILRTGKALTQLDEKTDEKQINSILNIFSRQFNVQIHIHIGGSDEVVKIQNNRLTDALVINIFKSKTYQIAKYASIYVTNFKILSPENHNISIHFSQQSQKINGNFIPIQTIKYLAMELADHILENKQIKEIKNDYERLLQATGDIWPFSEEIQLILNTNSSSGCVDCKSMKSKITLECNHGHCLYCAKNAAKKNRCGLCNMVISPNYHQYINEFN